MTITEDTVKHVATLARLTLTDEEASQYARELSQIMALVDELNTLDLDGIDLDHTDAELSPTLREDKAERLFPREALLANAPAQEDNCFQVPKILSDEED